MIPSAVPGDRLRILGAALLFSTGGTVIKLTALDGWQVACFRSGVAALALAALMPRWRRDWDAARLVVGVAYAATLVLFVLANKLTTAANSIFLQSTAPLYLLLFGPLLLAERPRRADLTFGAALAVGLVLFFVGEEPAHRTAPNPLLGNVLGAVAGVTWALAIAGLRRLGTRPGRAEADAGGAAVVIGNLLAFVACLPFVFSGPAPRAIDAAIVGYLGVFQIGLAYVWMTRGIRGVPALEASLLLVLEPVASALWAWWIHGERPGTTSLVGCGLILAATVAHTLRPPTRSAITGA